MRIKVELFRVVLRYLRHECSTDERALFSEELQRVRDEPIARSQAIYDPNISKYMLRFFHFGEHMAMVELDVSLNVMRVVKCRKAKPRHLRDAERNPSP